MKSMTVAIALMLTLGTLCATAQAQGFGPKNYSECVMVQAKRAQSRDGGMLIRRACKCRYQEPDAQECKQYSRGALDCMIHNLVPVQQDQQAWGVERACRTKHPVH